MGSADRGSTEPLLLRDLPRRGLVSRWYHRLMAMTLRPDEELNERLRAQAEAEGRSMQAVALSAIDEYISRRERSRRVVELAERGGERYAEALDRLGSL